MMANTCFPSQSLLRRRNEADQSHEGHFVEAAEGIVEEVA